MGAGRVLCLAAVFALVCVGLADESAAAKPETIDLTDYLDSFPATGDFHVSNRSDGQTERADVLNVVEHKKSTEYLVGIDEAGEIEQDTVETVHGKEDRIGSVISGDLVFAVRRPRRVQSFVVVPGVPQKFKVGYTLFYQGRRAGKATLAGTSTFVGFEPVSTPLGDFAEAARFHREQTLTIKVGHTVFQTISVSDSLVTIEFGTVFGNRVAHSYQDGAPLETFGPFEYTLDHGQYQGVPYP